MRTNPDPTLHELETRAKLAAGRLEAARAELKMEEENFKECVKLTLESKGKIKKLRASLKDLIIDVEDAEAEAFFEQKKIRRNHEEL